MIPKTREKAQLPPKKELVKDSHPGSSINLLNRNNPLKSLNPTFKPSIGLRNISSDLNKFKVDKSPSPSPSLLDSKLLKFKKTGGSLSTSLLKQYKHMSNLSNSGTSIVSSTNQTQHRRTGSTKSMNNNYN
jgi:hypothetical protein